MKYVVDMEQPIKSVVKITGFSEWYLKAGTIPHIRSGNRIFLSFWKNWTSKEVA